jgi:putative phosphoesterase
MKIAILSDTHSRVATVERALALVAQRDVELILHCGDIEDADTVRLFPANTHFVFGNCDHDKPGIRRAVADIGATLHEPLGRLVLGKRSLAFLHGDDQRLLEMTIASGSFHYVFHGHTHQQRDERVGKTRVINPGALHRARPKTFMVLDVGSGEAASIVVE